MENAILFAVMGVFIFFVGFVNGTVLTDKEWQKLSIPQRRRLAKIQTKRRKHGK